MAVGPDTEDVVALIVADDLTGACDAGAHFAARGVRTQVAIDAGSHVRCDAAVITCNTHTRSSDASEMTAQLEPVLDLAQTRKPQILLKKIDSTLRGPVEREIAWMLDRLELPMAVLAAAFPGAGRVVREGRVEIAGDEFVVDIGACFANMKCEHAGQQELGNLRERIASELERGTQVLIVDAESDSDLREIARAERAGQKVLWAGSGGLARAMAAEVSEEREPTDKPELSGPVLVCAGSEHCVTVEQIRRLEQERSVLRVRADERGLSTTKSALERGVDVVLEFDRKQIEGSPDAALGVKAGVQYCGAMIVTGGDTALHVLQSLGAETLSLRNEVEPGIPWGEIEGGEANGKVFVTKSGGFGGRDSLLRCVEWLHPAMERRHKAEAL